MKTITQSQFRSHPAGAIRHATTKGTVTVVDDSGKTLFTIGGPQDKRSEVVELDGLDPADDSAWPLPNGWTWAGGVDFRFAYYREQGVEVWADECGIRVVGVDLDNYIPNTVIDTMRIRNTK